MVKWHGRIREEALAEQKTRIVQGMAQGVFDVVETE